MSCLRKTCLIFSRRFVFVKLINVAFKSGSVFHSNAIIFMWAKVTAARAPTSQKNWVPVRTGGKEGVFFSSSPFLFPDPRKWIGGGGGGDRIWPFTRFIPLWNTFWFKTGSARSPGLPVQCFTARLLLQLSRYINTCFSSLGFWSEIRKFDPSIERGRCICKRDFLSSLYFSSGTVTKPLLVSLQNASPQKNLVWGGPVRDGTNHLLHA